jgi:hypothetical protein
MCKITGPIKGKMIQYCNKTIILFYNTMNKHLENGRCHGMKEQTFEDLRAVMGPKNILLRFRGCYGTKK